MSVVQHGARCSVLSSVMSPFLHHHFPLCPTLNHTALAPRHSGAEPVKRPGEHVIQNTSVAENTGLLPGLYCCGN